MKKITMKLSQNVPSWSFCNDDTNVLNSTSVKTLCRFCVKTNTGHRCVLHDMSLVTTNGLVEKAETCVRATCGFKTVVEAPQINQTPAVSPAELIKATIKEYEKQLATLMSQGYPMSLAQTVAKQYITSNNT